MIILDTNVISELMKPQPNAAVVAWMARQARKDFSTTAIAKAEILYGVARLPDSGRKIALASEAERLFRHDFGGRVLPFDDKATAPYAEILSARRRAGRPMTTLDAQIAAIASAHNAAVATRNVDDFDACGIEIINPWREG